jgi:MFS family permease
MGGIVILVGLVAGSLLKEKLPPAEDAAPRPPFWREIRDTFRWDLVRQNPVLFLLFANILIASTGGQISFPYMLIYIEHFLGFSKSQISLIVGVILLFNVLLAVPLGLLADRVNRRKLLVAVTLLSALATFFFGFARQLPALLAFGSLYQTLYMGMAIASVAWMKDLMPEDQRGRFLGIRMIFWIALPMVIGPAIGSYLIQTFGIPTTTNGEAGFIPTQHIWWAEAVIVALSVLPLLAMKTERKTAWSGDPLPKAS